MKYAKIEQNVLFHEDYLWQLEDCIVSNPLLTQEQKDTLIQPLYSKFHFISKSNFLNWHGDKRNIVMPALATEKVKQRRS